MARVNNRPVGFPKTIGAAVDRLAELDREKDVLNGQLKVVKDAYATMESHVLALLADQKQKIGSGSLVTAGKVYQVKSEVHPLPNVIDWPKFYAHIVKTKSWELLQKRVGVEAWRERYEAKVLVPGTAVYNQIKLKLTQIRTKGA